MLQKRAENLKKLTKKTLCHEPKFSEGRDLVEDEPRTGRLTTSKTDVNVERVKSLVRSDRRLTIRLIAEQLNLNKSTVHDVLKNN